MRSKVWLLIVCGAFVAVVVGGALFFVTRRVADLSMQKARSDLRSCAASVEGYYDVYRRYPQAKAELFALDPITYRPFSRPQFWLDPWGHEYVYERGYSSFSIMSLGRDGTLGTADDLRLDVSHRSRTQALESIIIPSANRSATNKSERLSVPSASSR